MPSIVSHLRCLTLLGVAGCTPALNWRDVAVPEMAVQVQFPCKPQRHVQARIGLLHCEASGLRFVLGWRPATTEIGRGSPVETALQAMAQRMNASISRQLPGDGESQSAPRYLLISAEGELAWVQLWVSGQDLRQALVVGTESREHRGAAETFFASIRKGA